MRFRRLSIAVAVLAVVAVGVVPLASASSGPSKSATKYRVAMKISTTRAVANEDTVALTGTVEPCGAGHQGQGAGSLPRGDDVEDGWFCEGQEGQHLQVLLHPDEP